MPSVIDGDAGRNEGERGAEDHLSGDDQRQGSKHGERNGTRTTDQGRHEQQRSLEVDMVDDSAGGRLRDDGRETGGRRRDADRRRIPVAHVRQIDGEVGAHPGLDIGERKVEPGQRKPAAFRRVTFRRVLVTRRAFALVVHAAPGWRLRARFSRRGHEVSSLL